MNVVDPARYHPRPVQSKRPPYIRWVLFVFVVVLVANYMRPLPTPTVTYTLPTSIRAKPVHMQWPSTGQAAVAASGYGLLATNGTQTPLATASIAKVITALCVLQKLPLTGSQTGPSYTINSDDVTSYYNYLNLGGSVLPVQSGEQLTEYQAIEALMVPSANNIADSLVKWVFGSQSAYQTYATNFLQQHGLNNTHIGSDASGYDPSTTSTAADLTQIGLLALQNPVLMRAANQPTATFPVVGTVANYDTLLGQNGITGLKTGNNDADPGAFLFTANATIKGKPLLLTGAVLGAPGLDVALTDTKQLITSQLVQFEPVTIAKPRQNIGLVHTAWGATAALQTTAAATLVRWQSTPVTIRPSVNPARRNGTVGHLVASAGQVKVSTNIQLGQIIPGPSFWWRLTRH